MNSVGLSLSAKKKAVFVLFTLALTLTLLFVPRAGIEPALCCQNWILNPARLPVPPPGLNFSQGAQMYTIILNELLAISDWIRKN